MSRPKRAIPAVLVSGFLGSGKTTLVRRLLRHAQDVGERAAVVSNELGELGIDKTLLGSGGDAFVELAGGCVCCQLSNDLVDTLQMLWDRVRPDRVIVETSGVALPGDVQINFWRDPVRSWIGEDVVVVVVDAEQVLAALDLEGTFEDQITAADFLVLNKLDLVPAASVTEIEGRLRVIEPEAPILRATQARVDPGVFFPGQPGEQCARRATPRVATEHDHEQFTTEEVRVISGMEEERVVEEVSGFAALRVKGFVQTAQGVRVVQGVGPRVLLSRPEVVPPAALVGRLVVIRRAGRPR